MPYKIHDCEVCGRTLIPKEIDTVKDYNKRKTCDPNTGRDCRKIISTRKKMKGLIDGKHEPRFCEVCGKEIRYEPHKSYLYSERRVCLIKDSKECQKEISKRNAITRGNTPIIKRNRYEHRATPVTEDKSVQRKISEAEAIKLDLAQYQLNMACSKDYLESITVQPARSLSPKEIAELSKVYTPPVMREKEILPHFSPKAIF